MLIVAIPFFVIFIPEMILHLISFPKSFRHKMSFVCSKRFIFHPGMSIFKAFKPIEFETSLLKVKKVVLGLSDSKHVNV